MVYNSGTYSYPYFMKDHLGNIRVTFDNNNGSAEILQVNDYYPFGMRHNNTANLADGTQKYLYNGKELQEWTNWYDYGKRFYDPSIGRFISIDKLAMKYPYKTPYDYAENNPTTGIDLDGLEFVLPYSPTEAANSIKQWKVDPQSQAQARAMFNDVTITVAGVLLIAGSGGTDAPIIIPLMIGGYGVAAGTTKLVLDAAGKPSVSDQIPSTLLGVGGKGIDELRGGKDRKVEKTLDVVQNAVTFNVGELVPTALKTTRVIVSGVSAAKEYNKTTGTDKSASSDNNSTSSDKSSTSSNTQNNSTDKNTDQSKTQNYQWFYLPAE